MSGWHQTIIIGNVGRDPELRQTQGGLAVCNFSVAVSEVWYDKNTGEKQEKTTWYRVSCWRKLAETANQYVHKGMQIMVVGNVEAQAYMDNAGEPAASLALTARDMKFLGGGSNKEKSDHYRDRDHGFPDDDDISDIPF